MTYIDRLVEGLKQQLRQPWSADRSGAERVWFLVFDPDKVRGVLAREDAFRLAVEAAGKRWVEIDITDAFGTWMAQHRYADRYFARPQLTSTIADDFVKHLVVDIRGEIDTRHVDKQTLLVLTGTESLFGITKLAHTVRLVEDAIPGRLLVFFPGEYRDGHYRFLDARDGWNYLAIPIMPISGRGSA